MKKIVLDESMRQSVMDEASRRINESHLRDHHVYNYITNEILNGVFDWSLKRRMTAQENGATWYYVNGKKEMMCCGYSGISSGERDDEEGMLSSLAHEIFCKAEYLARTVKEGLDLALQYYGREFYYIAAKKGGGAS